MQFNPLSEKVPLMKGCIDEAGNRYGKLVVLYPVSVPGTKRFKWRCKCDCGNLTDVGGYELRSGNTKSCGCLRKKAGQDTLIDLTGQQYGFLTVIERDNSKPSGHGKPVYWICQCSCGRIVSITGNKLKRGQKSCGCYKPECFIDEIGHRYGKLTVIEKVDKTKDRKVRWRCRCDCGGEKITSGKSLRLGLTQSCGCIISKGEKKVAEVLDAMEVKYIRQYYFDDLKSDKNYPLYFDFYLPDYNVVIEYQGEQHYRFIPHLQKNEKRFQEGKNRDVLKRQYCNEKRIKMIEIPYTEYNKINEEYLGEVIK